MLQGSKLNRNHKSGDISLLLKEASEHRFFMLMLRSKSQSGLEIQGFQRTALGK